MLGFIIIIWIFIWADLQESHSRMNQGWGFIILNVQDPKTVIRNNYLTKYIIFKLILGATITKACYKNTRVA